MSKAVCRARTSLKIRCCLFRLPWRFLEGSSTPPVRFVKTEQHRKNPPIQKKKTAVAFEATAAVAR
jgi:hypothetical protein